MACKLHCLAVVCMCIYLIVVYMTYDECMDISLSDDAIFDGTISKDLLLSFSYGSIFDGTITNKLTNTINILNAIWYKQYHLVLPEQSVTITIAQTVMKQYFVIALEKLNSSQNKSNKNNNNILIPLLEIDRHSNFYGIEWILMIHIIHRNCDVGISFKYNQKTKTFIANAILILQEARDNFVDSINTTGTYIIYELLQSSPTKSFSIVVFQTLSNNQSLPDKLLHHHAQVKKIEHLVYEKVPFSFLFFVHHQYQ